VVGVEYDAVHAAAAGGDRRGERVADQAGTKMIGRRECRSTTVARYSQQAPAVSR
jgi:hypothetical protein